jgi:CRISPR-associated endonuclease/helicase Cas3
MGADEPAPATILTRKGDVDGDEPDPIYGQAIATTWKWLGENDTREGEERRFIDFGVEALGTKLSTIENLSELLAPADNAPMLLPAHLDLLCETSPTPNTEPDLSLYLHGRHGPPEVRVVWRCDLSLKRTEIWSETVALCPPASGEMLSVPLWRFRKWLASAAPIDDSGDVEGTPDGPEESSPSSRPCLVWRGRDRSNLVSGDRVCPGDVVIVPAAYGIEQLGQSVASQALGSENLDLWEPARASSGRPPALRLNHAVLAAWMACPPLKDLLSTAEASTLDRDDLAEAIDSLLAYVPQDEHDPAPPPSWWLEHLREVRDGRIEDHPTGGIVLLASEAPSAHRWAEPDLFADDDDLLSASHRAVSLDDHTSSVRRAARRLAESCVPEALQAAVRQAAHWHDAGKLDERFQVMLHHGDEVAAASANSPLAKSTSIPASPRHRQTIRSASGLPDNFRHEMLSTQLAERHMKLASTDDADLVLHLIASHHGHARPFAPVVTDLTPPRVSGQLADEHVEIGADERASMPAPHRIDSGLADRFWRLNRRYGWWGLAYLEAILRLADWYGSAFVIDPTEGEGG